MSAFVLKNVQTLIGGRDFSGYLNSVTLDHSVELLDATVFQTGLAARDRLPGLRNTELNHSGFWDSPADEDLFNSIGVEDTVVSMTPDDGAAGDIVYMFTMDTGSYNPGGSVGEILAFNVTGQGTGPLIRGLIDLNLAARTTTGNGAGRDLGTLLASEKLYAILHVTAVSGTNPTLDVIITSDVTGWSSEITRITFAQMSDVGAQMLNVSGPITPDDLYRAEWVIGGTDTPTFTFFVGIGVLT